jgi:ABC-type multidrug transport system permease subunit
VGLPYFSVVVVLSFFKIILFFFLFFVFWVWFYLVLPRPHILLFVNLLAALVSKRESDTDIGRRTMPSKQ